MWTEGMEVVFSFVLHCASWSDYVGVATSCRSTSHTKTGIQVHAVHYRLIQCCGLQFCLGQICRQIRNNLWGRCMWWWFVAQDLCRSELCLFAVMETLLLVSVAFGHPADTCGKPSLPDCSDYLVVAALNPCHWEGFWIHTCTQH